MRIDLDHFETIEELERDLIVWIKEEDIYSFDRYLNKEDVLKIVQLLIKKENIIKDIKAQLDYLETYSSKEDVFEDMKRRLDKIEKIIDKENK